jgi:hypothetical protein
METKRWGARGFRGRIEPCGRDPVKSGRRELFSGNFCKFSSAFGRGFQGRVSFLEFADHVRHEPERPRASLTSRCMR